MRSMVEGLFGHRHSLITYLDKARNEGFQVCKHELRWDACRGNAGTTEEQRTLRIPICSERAIMCSPVHFDRELCFRAVEVEDVRSG